MDSEQYYVKRRRIRNGVETEALGAVIDDVLGLGVRPPGGRELVSPIPPLNKTSSSALASLVVPKPEPACVSKLCDVPHHRFFIMKRVGGILRERDKVADGPHLWHVNRTQHLLQRLAGVVLIDSVLFFGDARGGPNCFLDKEGQVHAIDFDSSAFFTKPPTETRLSTQIVGCAKRRMPANYTGGNLQCEVLGTLKGMLEQRMPQFEQRAHQRLQNMFWKTLSCPFSFTTTPKRKNKSSRVGKRSCIRNVRTSGLESHLDFPWDAVNLTSTNLTSAPGPIAHHCSMDFPKVLAFVLHQRLLRMQQRIAQTYMSQCTASPPSAGTGPPP